MSWVLPRFLALSLLLASALSAQEDILDGWARALSWTTADGNLRARLSGSMEWEAYAFSSPAPALIDTESSSLITPRLVAFLDAQVGPACYAFVQVRADRGFDPGDGPLRGRIDEYALRFTPWRDGRLSVQAGKFAAVFGNWISRHGAWENPFVAAPLIYENPTGIWDSAAAKTSATLLAWAHVRPSNAGSVDDKYLRVPAIWGPVYAPGVSVSGAVGGFEYAAEVKAAGLSSRPSAWEHAAFPWRRPATDLRLGFRPNAAWNFGISAASGSYLEPAAERSLSPGETLGDYRQWTVGQDVSFAWHHFQLWAEWIGARFEVPRVGNADTWAYYVETRYKFAPGLSGALRWNEQRFGTIPDAGGGATRWGRNVRRLELAPAWQLTPHVQWKLQYSLEWIGAPEPSRGHLLATQLVVRF